MRSERDSTSTRKSSNKAQEGWTQCRQEASESRTIDISSVKIITLANPPFFEVPYSSFSFKRRLVVVEVKARFSHNASEVDHDTVFPALEPRVLDELMNCHVLEFLVWCVKGSRRFYEVGLDDEPPLDEQNELVRPLAPVREGDSTPTNSPASCQMHSQLSSTGRTPPHGNAMQLKPSASRTFINVRLAQELKLSIFVLTTESAGDLTSMDSEVS